jgi:hypothetical protein
MTAPSPLDTFITHNFFETVHWSRDKLTKSLAEKNIVTDKASLEASIERLALKWKSLLEDSANFLLHSHSPDELRVRLRSEGIPLCNERIEDLVGKSLRLTKLKVDQRTHQFNLSTDLVCAPSWENSAMYLPKVPVLVFYNSEGLSFAGVIAGVRLPLQSAWSKLPDDLKTSLGNISGYSTEVCVIFNDLGDLRDKPHANLFYHSWFFPSWKYGDKSQSASLPMGIFNPRNVLEAPSHKISLGSLTPQSVNPHDQHLSPDNARLVIDAKSPVSSFFAVAKDDSSKKCIITQHIVLNDNSAGGILEGVMASLERSNNLFELKNNLPDLGFPILLREDELEGEPEIFSLLC